MLSGRVRRVLVIEDDLDVRDAIGRILTGWGASVRFATTAEDARRAVAEQPPPDLIVADVRLPDGSIAPVLGEAAELSPAPIVVAMSGLAEPGETFLLGSLGVRAYLSKPFGSEELARAIEAACEGTTPLEPVITALVGRVPMRDLQKKVRALMVKEALARAEGSRSGAARLLRVTRQAVQQIVRGESTDDPR